MKLSKADAVNLNNLIRLAGLGGIESIVIDNGLASGLNNKNATMITQSDVPAFSQKVGLSRLPLLRSRLELILDGEKDFSFDAKESDRGEIVQFEFASGKTKVQFRCTSTALIKAPKQVNDDPVGIISISKEQLQLILSSIKVMGAKQITLIIKREGQVIFEVADSNNDKITTELDKPVEWVIDEDDAETFVHYFNTDIFSSLFRIACGDDGVSFSVGGVGTINIIVQGHPMYIFSQVDGD